MTPINRLPNGLLGFLGIKNGGRYPDQLATTLAPVWDLASLYSQTNAEYLEGVADVTGLTFTSGLQVPNGEVWWVHSFGVYSATLAAGEALSFALAQRDSGGSIVVPMSDVTPIGAPGERVVAGLTFPIILAPGSFLGVMPRSFTSGAGLIACSFDVRYARMTV